MTETVIYVRAAPDDVAGAVSLLPQEAVAGGSVANAMMTRCGMAALGRIRAAFIVKARGGTDEAGDRWKPLKPETIAYSRRHRKKPGDPSQSRVFSRAKKLPWVPKPKVRAAYAPSYALTASQNSRWWDVYRQGLAMYRGDKSHAARRAWVILKGEGATTLIAQYGGAQVDILRSTGLLLASLTPGVTVLEQVFRIKPGEVIVGTNRRGAAAHHRGIPGRLPQRRLWPEPSRWPPSWWRDILEQAVAGLIEITVYLVRRIAP